MLKFDHFQFKLAVIQKLMYELKLFHYVYSEGERFIELWKQGYYYGREDEMLKEHISKAVAFFERLEIPEWMAEEVYELYLDVSNDIYFQVNPQWLDKEEYEDGKDFTIVNLSKKELSQFSKLKKITFNSFNGGGKKLINSLENMGIMAVDYNLEFQQNQKSLQDNMKYHYHQPMISNEKQISPLITILTFILVVAIFTYLTINQFETQRKQEIEVIQQEAIEQIQREPISDTIIKVYDAYYDKYWLEDTQGQKITEETYYEIAGPYFKNQLLLRGGQCFFFDIDELKITHTFEYVEDADVFKDGKYKEDGFLVSDDQKAWYLLTAKKQYENPVVINPGTTTQFYGQTKFGLCYVDTSDETAPVVRMLIDMDE